MTWRGRETVTAATAVVAVVVAVVAAGLWLAGMVGDQRQSAADAGGAGEQTAAAGVEAEPETLIAFDGVAPTASPSQRTALAFLELDEPLARAADVLGEPDSAAPDINATTAHTWGLAGGAQLTVIADDHPPERIAGYIAEAPADTGVRLALAEGVVLGETSAAGLVERWGEHGAHVGGEHTDYLVAYHECQGPWPVVVKFDTHPPGAQDSARSFDAPLTWVLISYVDTDPRAADCPTSTAQAPTARHDGPVIG